MFKNLRIFSKNAEFTQLEFTQKIIGNTFPIIFFTQNFTPDSRDFFCDQIIISSVQTHIHDSFISHLSMNVCGCRLIKKIIAVSRNFPFKNKHS